MRCPADTARARAVPIARVPPPRPVRSYLHVPVGFSDWVRSLDYDPDWRTVASRYGVSRAASYRWLAAHRLTSP